MGEDIFDELARALAKPMPRRRALRLAAGVVAAALVPGLRPGPAGAASAARGPMRAGCTPTPRYPTACQHNPAYCCPAGAPACCPQALPSGNRTCCAKEEDCCGVGHCCAPDEVCKDGACGCPPNRDCPDGCCAKGDVCVDGKLCCKEGQARCGLECCQINEECIKLRVGPTTANFCMPRCPQKRARCGRRCCPKGEKCVDQQRGVCAKCAKGQEACGKKCCDKKSLFCCDPSKNLCCKNGKESCCPVGGTSESTAPKRTCCAKPNKCTRELPPEIGGLTKSSKYVCCPPKRQVPVDETKLCRFVTEAAVVRPRVESAELRRDDPRPSWR